MFWGGVERDGEVSCVAGLMLTSGVTRTSWDLLGGGQAKPATPADGLCCGG